MRWQVSGIPDGEIGEYRIHNCTESTGEDSWLNYVNYASVPSGDYTVLYRKFGNAYLNIMQDTDREYTEHDWLTQRMSGDILIGGLGIGMVHIPLLASDDVTSVTVVESEQAVIDLVWDHCAKDDRFTLVHDDIHTWTPPAGSSWDVGWFDTWLTHDDDGNGNLITSDDYKTMIQNKYGSLITEIGGWNWS
jgi:hypothetical protein|tara:strand:+ start:33 stop:605 length:573 start_codon:yes stop_codon:yes gene_type:complete